MNKEGFIKKWSNFWTFQHNASQLTEAFEKELNKLTTPTQPALSAEDILSKKPFTHMGLDRHYGAQTVLNAMEEYRNQPTPFTYPRPPKEEAERLVNIFNSPYYPQFIVSYHRDNLQLRGLDTTYEEEVLTILKGM